MSANGGLTRSNMHVLQETSHKINVVGINDHELTGLHIVTASMVLQTNQDPIVGIFHEYAHLRQGSSIHAYGQLEWFHTQVDECSKIVGGQQQLVTLEGNTIPISIDSGLTYSYPVHVPSDHDLQTLPHVGFTSPQKWDLAVITGLSWNFFQPLVLLRTNLFFKNLLLTSLGGERICGYVAQHLFGCPNPDM